jgi:plastocyanin
MPRRAFLLVALLGSLPAAALAGTTVTVQVGPGLTFSPPTVNIQTGDTVHWVNVGGGFHNVQADDNSFMNDPSGAAWTFDVTFNNAGTNPYHCVVHSFPGGTNMNGVVNVTAPPPQISIDDALVTDGNLGTTRAWFFVRLSGSSTSTVSASFATAPGTAAAGADYTASSGTVIFPAGSTVQIVEIPIVNDALPEGGETFFVNLTNPVGATIADPQGVATIRDGRSPKGDFNSDTRVDILWRHQGSGQNVAWFMDGLTLLTGRFTNPPAFADVTWNIVGASDFDNNGNTDLLWRNGTSGENVIWFMDGLNLVSGTFTNPSALADVRWKMVGTGDFNNDTRPDILWRHDTSGENVVWFMNGANLTSGTFTTPSSLTDVRWKMAGTGDFDLDGKVDILWRHQNSGENVVWFMNGTVLDRGTFLTPAALADTGWRIGGTGDYNGDGNVDIVWRHATAGQNVIWFMDGTTLVSGDLINTLPDTGWQMVGPR